MSEGERRMKVEWELRGKFVIQAVKKQGREAIETAAVEGCYK